MAHQGIFPRRGSNTGSGSASALTASAVSNNIIPTDDYQSPLVIQPPLPAGSSSPGPQHHPQSLNLLSQSQLHSQMLQANAPGKKKSGFQITSVTSAQISVSTNNSITEDTESCDDLDESHTEDLSSSEILDVSLSRATDMGGPERSSSEETLNNFQEAETPGATSPNQPPHLLPHGPMVNGTAHHPHRHNHHPNLGHHHQAYGPPSEVAPPSLSTSSMSVGGSVGGATTSGALPSVAQKLPASLATGVENTPVSKGGVVPQPVAASATSAAGTGTFSTAAVAAVSTVNPLISNISDMNMLRSAVGLSPGLVNVNSGLGVNTAQRQSGALTATAVTMTTAGVGPPTAMGSAVVAPPSPHVQPQQAPAPAPTPTPASTSSRFRVVKLDSNSEPFKKGRWTCTEYYEKEAPADGGAPGPRAADGLRQPAGDDGAVGFGETGVPFHAQDYAAPPGVQNPHAAPLPQIGQDAGLPKTGVAVQQQLTYAQAGQAAQVGYPSAQQPTAAAQGPPAQHLPIAQPGMFAPGTPHPLTHLQGGVPPSASSQPMAGVPSTVSQALPQGHLQQGAHLAQTHPQGGIRTQPLAAEQLPPRTQLPSAVTLNQGTSNVPPSLLLQPRPGLAQGQGFALPYGGLPSLTATQLEDAQRLLFQHQSLLSLPKLAAGEGASGGGGLLGPEDGGGVNALPAGAGLFPLKSLPMDGEEDR
ncbi:hypothetical protein AAFF_G00279380 [Aldrovandia affinis]|uniref:TSC22 domain family protein 1 n=1 Tax=Aldrovandia affinis TaxID=143900 RepID=A0AAD7SR51_9TELE|nr:hypothetical protein AAFF_G00279380 [Aldrovandia affinis]